MNGRRAILAAIAIVAPWSAVFAQTIDVPPLTPLGQPIVAKVELAEGSKVVWKADAGSSVINAGKGRAYVWAAPGGHNLQAVVAPGGDAELLWLEATYAVGDAPPTPPVLIKTLAELAGDQAAILAELLTDLREAALPIAPTTDALKNGLEAGFARANVPVEHPAAVEIVKRLDACGRGKIDEALRKSLDAALAQAIAELGAQPPVPPVVEGKRRVVVLHETSDDTPELSQLLVKLRRQEIEQYLRAKGHRLDILDDDQLDSAGRPDSLVSKLKALGVAEPALFILELASGDVIHQQPLPATPEAVMEALKSHGG